jgi:glycosyltransferase involved in cell wall biosynthesis
MKEQAKSFAFIKIGSFSGTNDRLLEHLSREFPDLDADVIDIQELKAVNRSDAVRLLYSVARDYGLASCLTKSRVNHRVIRTAYCFRKIREHLLRRLSQKQYVFTFQTQSLFDASIPGTPHFLYTDHTHLANLTYPGKRQTPMASAEWVGLERSVYQKSLLNFTMSAHVSRSLVEQYGCLPTRVECVYAGANVERPDAGNLGLERFAQKNILFVGIDWHRKGGAVLLEAFREVRRTHPTAQLTIVGCAPKVSMAGCRVVGRVKPGEVAKFYQTASLFCLPTIAEPFGIVLLEAFAHGLPIVTTNIGAIPDFVEQGRSGYMVECNDAAQLVNRLNELLGDPFKCAAFGARGQALVDDRYTWRATAESLAAHIKRSVTLDAGVGQHATRWPATNASFAARVAL